MRRLYPGLHVLAFLWQKLEGSGGKKFKEVTQHDPKQVVYIQKPETVKSRRSELDTTIQEYGRVIKRNDDLGKWRKLKNLLDKKLDQSETDEMDLPGSWRIM